MQIVICDDDQAYTDAISVNVQSYFTDHHLHSKIHAFTNGSDVLNGNVKYDIAFLDIEMQPISGIELALNLKKINPKIIIFMITSYNQYLDDAMDLHVFRYIQKPLDIKRLFSGLDKAIRYLQQSSVPVFLHQKNKSLRIFSEDIVYIEIVSRHTQVVTKACTYRSDDSIQSWYERLPKTSFYMVHSSFIININHVTTYARDHVILNDSYTVPIAYRKRALFRQFFSEYCRD